MVIIKGDVVSINITSDRTDEYGIKERRHNIVTLCNVDGTVTIDCLVPKLPETKIDFSEKAIDVVAIGNVVRVGDGIMLGTYSLIVDEKFRTKSTPIKEEKIEEEIIDNEFSEVKGGE